MSDVVDVNDVLFRALAAADCTGVPTVEEDVRTRDERVVDTAANALAAVHMKDGYEELVAWGLAYRALAVKLWIDGGRTIAFPKGKNMAKIKLTEEEYRKHCDDMDGVCLQCREITFGDVEQDTEERTCPYCDKDAVMGFEQALVHEHLEITVAEETKPDGT